MARDLGFFEAKAKQLRLDILEMIYNAQSGHLGGSFSEIDVLTALFFDEMNVDPKNPKKEGRDRFVLSKGHTAPALYAVLADKGFFPKEWLMNSFRGINAHLQGHPDMKKTPGVEMTSGSLGMGLSAANGMAMAAKLKGQTNNVYCMMGDGEINEGQIWEAAATAAHFKLDNMIAFVDVNGLQNDNYTNIVKEMNPISDKWRAFGWDAVEIDGHDFGQIFEAVDRAKQIKDKPAVIIIHTVKGKGVSFMENVVEWHGKAPNTEDYEKAKAELTA